MEKLYNNNLSLAMGIEVPVVYEYSNLNKDVINTLRAELRGQPLIYAIHRIGTTDLYIGSTVEPNIRFYNHFISGKDSNEYLQNAFSKYGKENFTLFVLHLINLPKEASRKQKEEIMISFEQMYFDLLNPTYNFIKRASPPAGGRCKGASGPFAGRNRTGILHSESSKLLISENTKGKNIGKTPINKGKKLSEKEKALSINASSHRLRRVYLYDEDNNLVTIYSGLNIACNAEKCSKATMTRCIKNNESFRGWFVRYDQ